MKRFSFALAAILAAGPAAFAQSNGTDQILQVARNTWPGGQTVGIVCNYAKSGEHIRAMLGSFAAGSTVKVIDARTLDHVQTACKIMERLNPQFVLLLPRDPLVRDGSLEATWVINRMNDRKIPTLATTPAALAQGAWAVVGPATGNILQVNPALEGYYGKIEITPMTSSLPVGKHLGGGRETTLSVIAAF